MALRKMRIRVGEHVSHEVLQIRLLTVFSVCATEAEAISSLEVTAKAAMA